MAEYIVSAKITTINFAPETVVAEVIQNARTLLSTVIYSVPYDRSLGVNGEYLDNPINLNMALLSTDIVQLFKDREPRAQVLRVNFESDPIDGILKPVVRIFIDE